MLGWEAFSSCWAGKPFHHVGLGSPFVILGWEALSLCWAGKPFQNIGLGSPFNMLGWEAFVGGGVCVRYGDFVSWRQFLQIGWVLSHGYRMAASLNIVLLRHSHMINEGQYPCCDVGIFPVGTPNMQQP